MLDVSLVGALSEQQEPFVGNLGLLKGAQPPQRRAWSVTVAVTMVGMAVAALLPAQATQLQG